MWYLQVNGKVEGPKATEEVRDLLWTGDIANTDPIFRQGDNKWRPIREFDEFIPDSLQTLHEVESGEVGTQGSDQWIILSRKNKTDFARLIPIGPFTRRQVIERLQSGETAFVDYIWKTGFSAWSKISDVSEFSRLAPVESKQPVLPSDATSKPSVETPVRWELSGHVTGHSNDNPSELSQESAPEAPDSKVITSGGHRWRVRMKMGVLMGTLGVLFLALHFGLENAGFEVTPNFLTFKEELPTEAIEGSPATLSQELPQSSSVENTGRTLAQETPSHLRVGGLKLDTPHPQLFFETNAGSTEPLRVQVIGRSGEVLRDFSFLRVVELRRGYGELPTLDMSSWDLPSGNYTVIASVGSLRDEVQLFVGLQSAQFKDELEEHRRQIAFRQQIEKMTLVHLAKRVQKMIDEESSTEGSHLKELEKIENQIIALRDSEDVRQLAYPMEVEALLTSVHQLKKVAGSSDQQRQIASVESPEQNSRGEGETAIRESLQKIFSLSSRLETLQQ